MTPQIQVLKQTELCGQQFEVYGTPQEPLFKAKAIAEVIGHSNITKMLELVEDSEKGVKELLTPGGNQQVWFLTEDGLYEVLMQSRKPIAKQFKKGVKTILKEIRQTGGYLATRSDETPEEIMARALVVAQATIERHTKQLASAQEAIKNQAEQLTAQAPKVLFAEAIMGSKTSCLIGELAKIITQNGYEIGEKRLFKWLREHGYLGKKGEYYNMPNQRWMEQGYFEIKKGSRSGNDGVMHTTQTPKVTPKGQAYFIEKFLSSLDASPSQEMFPAG